MISRGKFYILLSAISLLVAGLIVAQSFIPTIAAYASLSWALWIFFILFTVGVYFVAQQAIKSANKNQFTNVVLGSIMVKLLFSIFIILGYYYAIEPDTKLFLIPFFGIYLFYTAFEVYILLQLGNTGQSSN